MEKIAIYITLILFLGCHPGLNDKKLLAIKNIPPFRLLGVDSVSYINSESLPSGSPLVFIYFSPDCEHCKTATEQLLEHKNEIANAKIFFITIESLEDARKFSHLFHLDSIKNIFVGKDYDYSFYKSYIPPTSPYAVIYSKEKILKKIYQGESVTNSIIRTVNQ